VVFTVNPATKALAAHSVQIGAILGENIQVISGLTPDMEIVTDARGLTAGQKVSLKQ
jgi:multidrug efflux pump subunit AcrA (membrane-fusion protein)